MGRRNATSPSPVTRCAWARGLAASLLAACAAPLVEDATIPSATSALPSRPHIVYVLTDDQRWDTMPGVDPANFPQDVFPHVERRLMDEGVAFTGAYNSNPLCAPSRASLLAGGVLSHNTGVLRNQWPNGSALSFDDARGLGPYLQRLGYRTAYIGKYPNGHTELVGRDAAGEPIARRHYIPPGWDVFVNRDFTATWNRHALTIGRSGPDAPASGLWLPPERERLDAFLSDLVAGGAPPRICELLGGYDVDAEVYVTDFERDLVLALLEDAADGDRPWLVIVAIESPHQPATPAAEDLGVYRGFRYRGRAVGEDDLTDKPPHVQRAAASFAEQKPVGPYEDPDELWTAMLESLRSVDRMVGALVSAVEAEPALATRTAFFFSSDNGYLWGEHGLRTKRWPYEESIRAPLCVRMPGLSPGVHDGPVAVDLDLPATFLALAGADPETLRATYGTDGQNLLPTLVDPSRSARDHVFCESFGLEAFGTNYADAVWAAVVVDGIKVVSYGYLVEGRPALELYDLREDPYELESRHGDPSYRDALERGLALIERQRGVAIVDLLDNAGRLPPARRGQPYRYALRAVGGEQPYRFEHFDSEGARSSLVEERLGFPPGLELSPSGLLSGVPDQEGVFEFVVRVHDSGFSPQHGGHRSYTGRLRLDVAD